MSPDPSSWSTASDIPPGMSMPRDQAVPFDEEEEGPSRTTADLTARRVLGWPLI